MPPAPSATPDSVLLHRYVTGGCEDAFAALVKRHGPMVFGCARRRTGGAAGCLAPDVAQQVFIALARRAHTIPGCRSLSGWLYLATVYEAERAVKRERRRTAWEAAWAPEGESPGPPPADFPGERGGAG